jgi:hypothetical protein
VIVLVPLKFVIICAMHKRQAVIFLLFLCKKYRNGKKYIKEKETERETEP